MGLNEAFEISISGIEAQKLSQELIASNIANLNSTRSIDGGVYRRKVAILEESVPPFSEVLASAKAKYQVGGVEVKEVVEDLSMGKRIYDPGHPDADSYGFVTYPNVSLSKEMVNLMEVGKLYEANIVAYNATKSMAKEALQLP